MSDDIRITNAVRPSDSNCPECGVAYPEYGCKCRWEYGPKATSEVISRVNRDLEVLRLATSEVDTEEHQRGCKCRICAAAAEALGMMRQLNGPQYPVEELIAAHKASVLFIIALENDVGPDIASARFAEGDCIKCGDEAIPNMPYCHNCRGDAMDLVQELKE